MLIVYKWHCNTVYVLHSLKVEQYISKHFKCAALVVLMKQYNAL